MKRLLLIFITFSILNKINAQVVFCPRGAEWHYNYANMTQSVYNESIRYTHDSIIGVNAYKVLNHKLFFSETSSGNDGPTLIKQSGDTVFMRNTKTQHTWQILYNFNVTAGQSWHCDILTGISNTAIATFTTTVDSVGTTVVNGYNLKQLYVHYSSLQAPYTYTSQVRITERFGCNRFLFNYTNKYASDWVPITAFLCYQDSAFGLKQFSSKPCDYFYITGIVDLNNTKNGLKLFPNPTSAILNVKLENQNSAENYDIRLVNTLGKEILSQQEIKSVDENLVLDLSAVEQGIYFLQIFEKEKLIATEKVVKE